MVEVSQGQICGGFYQYQCSLKGPVGGLRSVLSPAGAISGLTADTSQMDPVASVQGGMFGERDICYLHIISTSQAREGKKGFLLNIYSTFRSHTREPVS